MAVRVENVLMSALQELANVFGAERVINAAGQVLQTAAQTRAAVDDNMATMLGLAGLPSKSDLDSLRRQLDVVQATLANLSRKVDRLVEEASQHDHPSHAPGRRRASRIRPGDD
jgi:hypothetical protein